MILYVLLIYSFYRLRVNTDKVYIFFSKPWHKIVLFFLEAYATFSVTGMYMLDSSVEYGVVYSNIVYFILSYIWIRPVVFLMLSLLFSLECKDKTNIIRLEKTSTRIILICFIMLPCILFLIAFNPAITSWDSEFFYDHARRIGEPDFSMSDWHPPFYVFILSILIRICDHPSFLVILQCLYFSTVFVDGILYFAGKGISKKILAVIYCFIAFGISNIIQMVTIWHDIPYMISILWLTILLIKYVLDTKRYENRWGWYLQVVIALVFTALFRQNGIMPVMAVIIFLPVVFKKWKKMLAVSVFSFLMIVLVKQPLYKEMGVYDAPQLKFFALANDILYCYYNGDEISDEAMEIVNKITFYDPENFEFSANYVMYNGAEPSGYSVTEFLKIYMDNVIRNPRDALMAVLIRNSVLWSIAKPQDEIAGLVNYLGERNTYEISVYPFRQPNILTEIFSDVCNVVSDNSVLFILYWRTGLYHLFLFFIMGVFITKIEKEKGLIYMIPFVPAVMNLTALFIASGWSDYRYFWPSMSMSLFLICYFIKVKEGWMHVE